MQNNFNNIKGTIPYVNCHRSEHSSLKLLLWIKKTSTSTMIKLFNFSGLNNNFLNAALELYLRLNKKSKINYERLTTRQIHVFKY